MWLLLLAAATICQKSRAAVRSVPTISTERAYEAAREQVYWDGRACPLITLADDFLNSIYGKTTYRGLSAVQVIYGWHLRPDAWKDEPMILIPDADLRKQLGIKGSYASFAQLFDDTLGYRLNSLGADLPERMRPIVRESQPAIELDEKVGMIILLTQGKLIQSLPDSIKPLPDWRVEMEILYHTTPFWTIFLIILALAVFAFFILKKKKLRKRLDHRQQDK